SLNDPINNKDFYLYIANMDADDNIDDILRLEVQSKYANGGTKGEDVTLIWLRSKNGVGRWEEFKRHTFNYNPSFADETPIVYPKRGFVGRFEAENAGTMVIDEKRIGHFFSLGHPERQSWFPY